VIIFDFSVAIAIFALIILAFLLLPWVLEKKHKNKDLSLDAKFIWFCSICSYTYINTKQDIISLCPRCGSYNKKE
jgi:hypothetical protein